MTSAPPPPPAPLPPGTRTRAFPVLMLAHARPNLRGQAGWYHLNVTLASLLNVRGLDPASTFIVTVDGPGDASRELSTIVKRSGLRLVRLPPVLPGRAERPLKRSGGAGPGENGERIARTYRSVLTAGFDNLTDDEAVVARPHPWRTPTPCTFHAVRC